METPIPLSISLLVLSLSLAFSFIPSFFFCVCVCLFFCSLSFSIILPLSLFVSQEQALDHLLNQLASCSCEQSAEVDDSCGIISLPCRNASREDGQARVGIQVPLGPSVRSHSEAPCASASASLLD